MKIFVTGGTGKLGQCLIPELQKDSGVEVYAPPRRIFDITQPSAVWQHMQRQKDIDVMVHCAAQTDVPGCESDSDTAHMVNVLATSNLANFCSQLGWSFVYISTDYVFNGERGNYTESDVPSPINTYGHTKLCSEVAVQLAYHFHKDRYAIIRTSLKPLGEWPYPKAFTDIYSSADYVDVIAHEIALAIRLQVTGIIHIATERKSIYELAKKRTPNVGPMSRKDIKDVNLPFDVSLDVTRWETLKKRIEEQYCATQTG